MQSKGIGKFRSKQFGCKKRLDLFTVDVLNGFYCNKKSPQQSWPTKIALKFFHLHENSLNFSGVVGAIVPWNFPLMLLTWKVSKRPPYLLQA